MDIHCNQVSICAHHNLTRLSRSSPSSFGLTVAALVQVGSGNLSLLEGILGFYFSIKAFRSAAKSACDRHDPQCLSSLGLPT